MKNLKLFEDYTNSPTNKVHTLLKNMVTMFKDTFGGSNGVLGDTELNSLTLVDVEASIETDPFEKNVVLDFSDPMYYYQMIFVVKIDDATADDIKKAYMKIKIYTADEGTLLREWQSNIDIEVCDENQQSEEGRFFVKVKDKTSEMDFIENFIIGKISNLLAQFDKNKNR